MKTRKRTNSPAKLKVVPGSSMRIEVLESRIAPAAAFAATASDLGDVDTFDENPVVIAGGLPPPLPVVTLTVSPASVLEDGSSNLVYTFTRSGDTSGGMTVFFSENGSTAAFDTDYSVTGSGFFDGDSGSVTFAPGATTATLTLDPTTDASIEPDETIALMISFSEGYQIGSPGAATGTITNDDLPVVTLTVSPASVSEDGTSDLVFTFTRSPASGTPLVVNFSASGDATFASDYTHTGGSFDGSSGTVVIPGELSTATLILNPTLDTTVEPDEAIGLILTSSSDYTIGTIGSVVVGTIANDDTEVSVAVSPSSVSENSGSLSYTFTRSGVLFGPLTVNFNVSGAAGFTSDYTQSGASTFSNNAGTVTFAFSSTTATVELIPVGDTTIESDEDAVLTVVNGTQYTAVGSPATGTILNDDTEVTIAVAPTAVLEDGSTNLVFTFTRTGVTTGEQTVFFSGGGTADFSTDYSVVGSGSFDGMFGSATFAPNATTATLTFDPTADVAVESDETIALTLSPADGYTVGIPGSAAGTFTNDDSTVTLAVAPSSVAEDGGTNLVYTFTRTGSTASSLTVGFDVSGSSTFTNDYSQTGAATFNGTTGTVTFLAGSATATVTLDPAVDAIVEPDETIVLTLTGNPSSAVTGMITNDDSDVSVAVAPASVTENGVPNLTYTFTRTGLSTSAITVNFSVGGTATFSSDYGQSGAATFSPTVGTVTLGAGVTTANVIINPTGDAAVEADETAILTVTTGSGYNPSGSPASGTIINDDTEILLAVAPSSVTEDGGTNLVYTFTRNGVTSGSLAVDFDVAGTATFNTDYTQSGAGTFSSSAGSVTFAPGATTATVTLDPAVDITVEGDETTVLMLAEGPGYNIVTDVPITGTIVDDDTSVTLAVAPSLVTEDGASNLVYTFTRTGPTSSSLLVNFSVGGTATPNTDYTQTGATSFGASGSVTIPAGSASATITLDPTSDPTVENDETTSLTLTSGAGYAIGSPAAITATIANDDSDISVAVAPSSVNEDGSPNLVYTFTRAGSSTSAVTVDFSVGGTATFGSDYAQSGAATFNTTAGTVTFGAGVTTATVTLNPTGDGVVEPDETAILTVTAGTGYNVSGSGATGTITNDDTDVSVAVSPASIVEDGAPNLVYTFTRNGVTTIPLTVNFSVGGTAAFGSDYTQTGAASFTSTAGTVSFAAGANTTTVTLDPTADSTVEGDETALLTVTSGTGYNVSGLAATGTITNDDASITLALAPSAVTEDGATNLVYTFTRSGVTSTPLTVNFVVGGSATLSSDYSQTGAATFTATTGTVIFAAGATTATVTLDPVADSIVEADETTSLALAAGSGYIVGSGGAVIGTITNDDTSVTLVAPSLAEIQEDSVAGSNLVYTFSRAGVTATPLTVNFSVGGTASFATDYTQTGAATFTSTTGTVTFSAGATTASVAIDPTADTNVEPDETVSLTLISGSGYTVGTASPAVTTIRNDDTEYTVSVAPASVTEDGSTNLVYTITASGVLSGGTVFFSIGGTAAIFSDYSLSGSDGFEGNSGAVTFGPGQTTRTIIVDPTPDTVTEDDETVVLSLNSPTIGTPGSATGTISNDDSVVTLALSPSAVAEDGSANLVYTFTRTGAVTSPLTVNFGVAGTATFNTDYSQAGASAFNATTGTVTFAAGANTATVTLDPAADTLREPDETTSLTLANGSGYTAGTTGAVTGTITNDDTDVSVAVAPASVAEDGVSNLVYTFTRAGLTTNALTINFSVGGTSTFGTDYTQTGATSFTSTAGTVTFTAGTSTATVILDPTADTAVEVDESALLTVTSGTGYNVSGVGATGTITNDDTSVALSVAPSAVNEDGATNLVYTFTRSGVTSSALTVNFTVGGTATFSTDYTQSGATSFTSTSGVVTFAAGASTATVNLDPAADTAVEGSETTILTLATGSGYTIGTAGAVTGTIAEDDTLVSLMIAPAAVAEDGSTNLVYTFLRTGATSSPLTVDFTLGGTATFNTDYTQTGAASFGVSGGTVTFAAGAAIATITLDPTADTAVESDETTSLTLISHSESSYEVSTTAAVTGTINNDDTDVSVAVAPASATEDGAPNLLYTFTRSGVTATPLTINFNVGGTATFGTDYTQTGAASFTTSTGTVSFAAGAATATVALDPTADTIVEGDETALLTVTSGAGYNATGTSAAGTITNDDTSVTLAVAPASVTEDGATNLVYTFTRTGITSGALTVNFAVAGTATFTTDYLQTGANAFSETSGSVSFAPGATTAIITLDPVTDTTPEADETASLTLANGSGYTAATTGPVIGTIANDDTNVTLAVTPSSVTEDGAANLVYTFTRTGITTNSLVVNFTTGGTATLGTDYTQTGATSFTATTGTVTFAAGATTATVTVDPTADSTVESDETVILTVIGGSGYNAIASSPTSGTITNDDVDVSVSLAVNSVTEDGASNLVYVFSRSGATSNPLTVNFSVGGTAAFGSDYSQTGAATFNPTTGSVTFAAGSSMASVTIDPTADSTVEPDETAVLTVTSGTGYNVGVPTVSTGTIQNDDSTVTLAVAPASVIEDGTTNLVYTFTRAGFTSSALTVNFIVGGTAIFGTDYLALGAGTFGATTGTVVFQSGQSTATVTIDPTADTTGEANETVALTLTSGSGYSAGTPGAATGTISDDDAFVNLAVAPASVLESSTTGLVYTFTRIGDTSGALTVNFNVAGSATFTADYSATGGTTFSASGGTVTLPAGATTATLALVPVNDTIVEGNETTILSLAAGAGYGIGSSAMAQGTFTDNDTATIEFATDSSTNGEASTPANVGVTLLITANGTPGTGTLARNVTVNVQDLLTGSATSGADYTFSTPQTLTFAAGEGGSSRTVALGVVNDALSEGSETVRLQLNTLTESTGGLVTLGNRSAHTLTIADNDIDLRVTKTESAPLIVAGSGAGNLTYTVTVTNVGRTDATGVVLSEDLTLVPGATFVSATPSAGNYALTTSPDGTWTLDNLAAGANATLTVVLTVGSSTAAGTNTLSNTASISNSTESRINTSDDSATESTSVQRLVDLQVTKTDGATSTTPGSLLTYAIEVSNTQPSDANGVILTETLPAGTTFSASASSAGWTQNTTPGTYTLNLNTITGGSKSAPIAFAVMVNGPAASGLNTIDNRVSVADDGTSGLDPTPINNVAIDSNALNAAPDLVITKTGLPLITQRGGLLTYSLAYKNVGSQNAVGVSIAESLPANATFVSGGSTTGWVETAPGSGSYRFDVGALSANQSGTLTFQVHINETLTGDISRISNSVTIADDRSNGADLNPSDNTDTLTTPVYQGIAAFALGRVEVGGGGTRGTSPQVKVFDIATGQKLFFFLAYEATATAGVRIAVGDINGDGFDDVITAYAQGTGRVRVFDGVTGDNIPFGGQKELNAFGPKANTGAFVAAGDVTGDGRDDIIVGAGFQGKKLKVYDGVTGQVVAKFNPFGAAATGVRVAVGDVNGDGIADIIAGQRSVGSGVRAFLGGSLPATGAPELLAKAKFGGTDGVFVAAGDVTGDGLAEIIMGSGERSPSKLTVYSPATKSALYTTDVFEDADAQGVRVAAADINLDGIAEIIAAPSGNADGQVLFLNGADGVPLPTFTRTPFPNTSKLGIYVAGTNQVPFVQTVTTTAKG